ncbi:hypothetical protein Drorol1_Dr00026799 [Drosera rotundifolia]
METKIAKVLDSPRRLVDLNKHKAVKYAATYLPGESQSSVSQLSALRASSVKLGKRKKPDVCKTKCRSCKLSVQRSLLRGYRNFTRSRLPDRLMFFQNDEWVDHSDEILAVVRRELEDKKPYFEVHFGSYQLILDFLTMVQLDVKTGTEKPIAWIDEAGSCFFPEIFADDDEQQDEEKQEWGHLGTRKAYSLHGSNEIKLQIDIDLNGICGSKITERCGDSNPLVKRIRIGQEPYSTQVNDEVEDSCDGVADAKVYGNNESNELLHGEHVLEIDPMLGTLDPECVNEMFLRGMDSVAGASVVETCRISGSILQGRKEVFQQQLEITKKFRGVANIRYAWLPSTKDEVLKIMTYGLGYCGLPTIKSSYGNGVHLSAERCSGTSAKYCDVDENGLLHMVLCRVIMGKMEVISSESQQFYPSGVSFDSGVDDLQNPKLYVVWGMNMNTHIFPEYVVSFKVSSNGEGCLIGPEGKLGISRAATFPDKYGQSICEISPVDAGSDVNSNVTSDGTKEGCSSLLSSNLKNPKSPWMPFPMLFAAISDKIPSRDMNLLNLNYELLRMRRMSREDFVKVLRMIAGDALLKSTIEKLQVKIPPSNNEIEMQAVKQEVEG